MSSNGSFSKTFVGNLSGPNTVGFKQDDIDKCLQRLKKIYNEIDDNAIYPIARSGEDLSRAWACPSAVQAINKYKTEMMALLQNVLDNLVSIADHITLAYEKWCNVTGCQFHYPGDCLEWFGNLKQKFNYEPYENINGVMGVDADQAKLYVDYLSKNYAERLYNGLDNVVKIINECGFIGLNQQQSLSQSVMAIKLSVSTKIGIYVLDFVKLIEKTVSEYRDTAGSIEQMFWNLQG